MSIFIAVYMENFNVHVKMMNMCSFSLFHADEKNCLQFSSLADRGGGGAGRTPPPMGPNSFIFAYIFTEKCLHQRSMLPLTDARPLWEILDPLLLMLW